jgi:hypothetical protein
MKTSTRHTGTTYGFARTDSLLQGRIRTASESRGFAVSRVLTHWAEIVGETTAAIARPVEVSYSKGGMGATLVVLTTGAQAPMLEMQKDQIRERVNACYGYRAIARVRITQTAPSGFSDGQVAFTPAPKTRKPEAPPIDAAATAAAQGVADTELRLALERLAANVLAKSKR